MISGSVSGVADCSVFEGCDAVPYAAKGRVTSVFRVKLSCSTALNVSVKRCMLASDVALKLCESKGLHGYSKRTLEIF